MKIDLVKSLQENDLYVSAIKTLPEGDRDRARVQIEGMLSELSHAVQTFVDQVQLSDDATKRDLKTVVDDADVVIRESMQVSGSHG